MKAQSFSDAVITDHAAAQIARRGISVALVNEVLSGPQQVLDVRPGRVVLQSRVLVGEHNQLIRVFVDVDRSPMRVVTAYRTSRINKYWSQP